MQPTARMELSPLPNPRDVADVVRGEAPLRFLERGFLYFDRFLGRVLPEPLNPFLQTGAITLTSLAVATISGWRRIGSSSCRARACSK